MQGSPPNLNEISLP